MNVSQVHGGAQEAAAASRGIQVRSVPVIGLTQTWSSQPFTTSRKCIIGIRRSVKEGRGI